MRLLFSALAGSLFGLGLLVSGMTDTARVQGFLDVAGHWDPSLIFVLGGAILPMVFAWRIAVRRRVSVVGEPIPGMPEQVIDTRLLAGSVLFGAGWALAGFCPGPALASLGWSGVGGWIFTAAMVVGMILHGFLQRRRRAMLLA
ncbi:DUF6691 family protein [Solirhodobacter olei]|uniref:DUF6691 family protein n=1 Tax=Solirhodobacter olei TaxID=2493082 RepID=UPI000FD79C6A|nr:DUF6691 family protein [Solirhodobacter olei]